MSELQTIGLKHDTDKAYFHKYLDFYAKHLPKRDFAGRLLEIGVLAGGSIRMWREYYPKAEIVCIDIQDPNIDLPGVTQLKMDSKDTLALQELGSFDIIIDDGSHMTLDQQLSFYLLYYSQLNKGGFYIIEDVHTSFVEQYKNAKFTTLEMIEKLGLKTIDYRRDESELDSMTTIIKAGQ